ncbi:DMT family transporter [Vibrio mexicanus]|uniref:DMT family transporter n=1 Tax=Vibrio mexicanus TaxID=1004326 RepID=UPI000AB96006
MSGTIVSFCLMAIGARELSGEINSSQVMLIRSVVGFVAVTMIIIATGKLSDIQSQKIKLHGIRNLFHFMGQYGWLLGIAALPLAEVFALEFTVPLWTAIIACLWLGEPLSQRKLLSIFLGLIGVVIILKRRPIYLMLPHLLYWELRFATPFHIHQPRLLRVLKAPSPYSSICAAFKCQ